MMIALYGVALLAGILTAVEPGQNSALSKAIGLPFIAALLVLLVGAIGTAAIGVATHKLAAPTWQQVKDVPWWAWLGGLAGAFIVFAQLFASDTIGDARFVGIIVTAGTVTSIILDNYALIGFKHHAANLWRVAGAVLMICGVALIAIF